MNRVQNVQSYLHTLELNHLFTQNSSEAKIQQLIVYSYEPCRAPSQQSKLAYKHCDGKSPLSMRALALSDNDIVYGKSF